MKDRELLEARLSSINAQLQAARSRHAETGQWADADWYRRAVKARAYTIAQLQEVKRRTPPKKPRERKLTEIFMNVAQERLPAGQFQEILGAALARLDDLSVGTVQSAARQPE